MLSLQRMSQIYSAFEIDSECRFVWHISLVGTDMSRPYCSFPVEVHLHEHVCVYLVRLSPGKGHFDPVLFGREGVHENGKSMRRACERL